MVHQFFECLGIAEDFLWGYIGFPVIIGLGLYLAYKSRLVQIRRFPSICRNFLTTFSRGEHEETQLHPIRAFFASIGGSLGIGNVVAVSAAVQIGGPGTLVWIWVTAIIGSLIKYSEVFIGMTHRSYLPDGTARGGPMFFLKEAFSSSWPSKLFCLLMCLYSVEIYQFGVVSAVTSRACGVSTWVTALIFLSIILIVERGGFRRVGKIASILVPCVVAIYVSMGTYVLLSNIALLPAIAADVFSSAFTARSAEGAFVGSTLLMAMSHGVRRGCYSSDIGVGYASIIHSASSAKNPAKQASLLIFEVFMDTFFVCTMSVLMVLVTGTWKEDLDSLVLVQEALSRYFPHMDIFVPFFLSLLGYSTVITYFSSGMHTVSFLMPVWGRRVLYLYAVVAFLTFSFLENGRAISIMSTVGFMLLVLNSWGIWKLRHRISFALDDTQEPSLVPVQQEG